MLTFIMDALRYREGALAAVWLSLGLTNMSLLFTTASLALERGIVLSLLTAVCNGSVLFMTGAAMHAGVWSAVLKDRHLLAQAAGITVQSRTGLLCRDLGYPAVQMGATAVSGGSCGGREAAPLQQLTTCRC